MTKIRDAFKEVFVGINLSTYSKNSDKQEVYTFKKENIFYNSILYNNTGYTKFRNSKKYEFLPNKDLYKIEVPINIKEKYYLKYGDIVISLKKPYKVFNDLIVKNDKIIVTNNYIILRGIDINKYYAPFLKYYIENVGIEKLLKDEKRVNTELSLEDVKNIELPNISKEEQITKFFDIEILIKKILNAENNIQKILNEIK